MTSIMSGHSSANNSADTMLEEYLETIAFLPSSIKRNLNLIASLDNVADDLGQQLKELQDSRLEEVQNIVDHARKKANLEKQTRDDDAIWLRSPV